MITPMIHRLLTRGDLGRLVDEMARLDVAAGRSAELALEGGDVDAVLDSPVALEAVRGRGGAPAPLPLTLLWYIPIRAELRVRGVTDVELADYTATLPVVFATSRAVRVVARGENGVAVWWRFVSSLPPSTVAQAEGAADSAALALWWAGCFPEWVARRGAGRGMIHAYVTFAGQMLGLAAELLERRAPDVASLWARAAEQREALHAALTEARGDYLGPDVHSAESRLTRFLRRLSFGPPPPSLQDPPTLN
ncbi:MAG: hypothetical protein AUH78_09955 [Gemmatimonadetes bacterium 13_1_40CM_4_69_8]|nr:MAG: hypothetical protein AUH78_09955 [Gemmatimonadetes bacterium 13_1_40CM_4_69_8]PYP74471.1 MAG: hypothetical protein DMD41_01470 [Gemmatimonadota bacterium]